MRSTFNWLLILCVGVTASCGVANGQTNPPSAPVRPASLFRFYFSGTARLAAETNAAPWVSMSALPASQALWRQTLEKLARSPYRLFQQRIAATTNNFAGTFQELIADFVRAESFAEATGDSNRIAECELAVRLPADRAEFWRTNLLTIFESWTGCRGEPLPAGTAGWQLKKHHHPNVLAAVRSGDWTFIGCGQDQLPLQEEYLQRIKQTASPAVADSNAWLEVFLDCPNVPPVTGHPLPEGLPAANLSLAGARQQLAHQRQLLLP